MPIDVFDHETTWDGAPPGGGAIALGRAEVESTWYGRCRRSSIIGAEAADLRAAQCEVGGTLHGIADDGHLETGRGYCRRDGHLNAGAGLAENASLSAVEGQATALPPPSRRLVPVMVTGMPIPPLSGEMPVMAG